MAFACLLFCTLSWTILPPYIPRDTELHIHLYCKFFCMSSLPKCCMCSMCLSFSFIVAVSTGIYILVCCKVLRDIIQ